LYQHSIKNAVLSFTKYKYLVKKCFLLFNIFLISICQ